MGTWRRRSSAGLKLRLSKPPKERETLSPCPACGGSGVCLLQPTAGSYRQVQCRWCEARGYVDSAMLSAHARWLRILRWNRAVGAC